MSLDVGWHIWDKDKGMYDSIMMYKSITYHKYKFVNKDQLQN